MPFLGLAKRLIRPLVGGRALGIFDYIRFSDRADALEGPFNGQSVRQALFDQIVAHLQPAAIIETGTYLGTTTEFIARTGLPVFTIELDARRYGYARARFWHRPNISLLHADSRIGLSKLLADPLRQLSGRTLLFYLDAHWNEDLPLAEEIDIIFGQCPAAIVMIDDFEVPFDAGYGYDDYGPGRRLTARYIEPATLAHCLHVFYPSTPSTEEGGRRRGCVVLVKECDLAHLVATLPLVGIAD
jgi:hypothetical protein